MSKISTRALNKRIDIELKALSTVLSVLPIEKVTTSYWCDDCSNCQETHEMGFSLLKIHGEPVCFVAAIVATNKLVLKYGKLQGNDEEDENGYIDYSINYENASEEGWEQQKVVKTAILESLVKIKQDFINKLKWDCWCKYHYLLEPYFEKNMLVEAYMITYIVRIFDIWDFPFEKIGKVIQQHFKNPTESVLRYIKRKHYLSYYDSYRGWWCYIVPIGIYTGGIKDVDYLLEVVLDSGIEKIKKKISSQERR